MRHMSTTSVRIANNQYKELKDLSTKRGLKIAQVIRRALARYINESKKG